MNKPPNNELEIDAVTLIAVVSAIILLPLLLTGFISQ